jgi:LuxR family maltose regulon positive regulatory protein
LPVVLKRPRLFRLLAKAQKRPLIWITAPAGSGKTTLVASYLKARRLPVLWYRLDETDADPSSFFHFLSLSAKSLAPRVRKPLPVLTPEYALGLPTFARRFFQELCVRLPRRCVLVLDNYHEVPSQTVLHQLLPHAFQELPPQISVIVMSRQDPPPTMAALSATQRMTQVGAEPLNLLKSETQALVQLHLRGRVDRERKRFVDTVYERVGGWAAGVMLTLEHVKSRYVTALDGMGNAPETVFHYLASEITERLTPDKRELLLKTSVLSDISVPLAERLSNLAHAGEILRELHAGRYFTERREGRGLSYRYHPLFRDFLLHRAQQVMGPMEFRALQRRAAELLVSAGRIEDGVLLLQAAEDWDGLVPTILAQANGLIESGRSQTLEAWICSLPESVRNQNPWLNFWLATVRVAFMPDEAYGLYRQVFLQFRSQGDQVGSLMAWCGAVRAILLRWADMNRLDEWLDQFPVIQPEGAPFPSIEIEAQVADCMASAIMHRQPYRSDARVWLDKAIRLAEYLPPAIQAGSRDMLNIYHLWNGEVVAAEAGLAQFSRFARKFHWNPITAILFHNLNATIAWFRCEFDQCRLHTRKSRDLIQETGLHLLDGFVLSQGAIGELLAGKLDEAEALLKENDRATQQIGGIHRAHFLHVLSWYELLRGNNEAARIYVEQSRKIVSAEGGFLFGEGLIDVVAAHVWRALGKSTEAAQWVERALQTGDRMQSDHLRFSGRMIAAQLAFDRGDDTTGLDELTQALAIGEARGLMQYPGMERHVTASLCTKALNARIHVPFVQHMIQKHRLAAPPEAQAIDSWPWRIKIRTFGKLTVEVDGKPLEKQRKAPHRLLELLAAIITFRGQGVPVSRLIDALWPEADGDTGHENFKKSIARLRKLLAVEDVIHWQEGKISLNRDLCWVDVWAFDALGKQQDERAMAVYTGPFLGLEQIPVWAEPRRDEVRTRFIRLVNQHCDHAYTTGNVEEAIRSLERAIEADPVADPLYQRLIPLLVAQGRQAEAAAQFERCRSALARWAGRLPSPELQTLVSTIPPQ